MCCGKPAKRKATDHLESWECWYLMQIATTEVLELDVNGDVENANTRYEWQLWKH